MNKVELNEVIRKHSIWLQDSENLEGSRANLSRANLSRANLSRADLSRADLSWANLSRANLSRANLSWADLSWADLDFSCFPMWCGGSNFKCDQKLVRQFFAHICTLDILDADEEMKTAISAIQEQVKKSHRAADLGLVGDEE